MGLSQFKRGGSEAPGGINVVEELGDRHGPVTNRLWI
jgi:hypothetical protein